MIDQIIQDIQRTHIILNAESGHGKSSALRTIIKRLKEYDPKIIIKCFDPSQAWYWRAPLPHRQKITPDMLFDYMNGNPRFLNINDCVYEVGSLTEEERRLFAAIIINEDYSARRDSGYDNGLDAVSGLPRIVFVFEESDTYFDSASLNKKDWASGVLRDFIKIGRNFGLRAFCVATATVGELGTKFRRRSKHLIGKIISDSDYREYNRFSKHKIPRGQPQLGDLASEVKRFHWIYYNGEISEAFYIPDLVTNTPTDYVMPQNLVTWEPEEKGPSWFEMHPKTMMAVFVFLGFLLAVWLLR